RGARLERHELHRIAQAIAALGAAREVQRVVLGVGRVELAVDVRREPVVQLGARLGHRAPSASRAVSSSLSRARARDSRVPTVAFGMPSMPATSMYDRPS